MKTSKTMAILTLLLWGSIVTADWTAEISIYNFTGKSLTLSSNGYRCSYGINATTVPPSTPDNPIGIAFNFHDKVTFTCEVEYSLWSILNNNQKIAELVDTDGGKVHIDMVSDKIIPFYLIQSVVDSKHFRLCINNIRTDKKPYPLC